MRYTNFALVGPSILYMSKLLFANLEGNSKSCEGKYLLSTKIITLYRKDMGIFIHFWVCFYAEAITVSFSPLCNPIYVYQALGWLLVSEGTSLFVSIKNREMTNNTNI